MAFRISSDRCICAWFREPSQRPKLFKPQYPLAWGKQKVEADAFLTGLVKVSSDYKQGTVVIEELRAPGKAEKVLEFAFEGDTALLTDLGKSYSLGKRSLGIAQIRQTLTGPTLTGILSAIFSSLASAAFLVAGFIHSTC